MITKEQITADYQAIQDEICLALENLDGKSKFEQELWEREGGGGGRTRVIQNGNIIEKGGVNFSAVHGKLPEVMKKALKVDSEDFFATGVSIVIHPNHPLVPIIHMNIRYFEMPTTNGAEPVRWFGGGIDLTPHYVFEDDAKFFHQSLKAVCDKFNADFYTRFKTWADDYFYIKHREETRGIGGIFYDRLVANEHIRLETIFDFSKALGRSFAPTYIELVNRHRNEAFTGQQQLWQYLRRSRYAEFNLVYDAGTKFGLETNGRIESILMSLPPTAKWVYNYQTEAGSEEEENTIVIKKGHKLGLMQKWCVLIMAVFLLSAFVQTTSLKGTWQYAGGISNGKVYPAPDGYTQERRYTKDKFEAFLLEKGEKPMKYEAGNYSLKNDSCFETQTYSLQPSVLTGKVVHYQYLIKNDTLFLIGKLPNGIAVEDHWKKVK